MRYETIVASRLLRLGLLGLSILANPARGEVPEDWAPIYPNFIADVLSSESLSIQTITSDGYLVSVVWTKHDAPILPTLEYLSIQELQGGGTNGLELTFDTPALRVLFDEQERPVAFGVGDTTVAIAALSGDSPLEPRDATYGRRGQDESPRAEASSRSGPSSIPQYFYRNKDVLRLDLEFSNCEGGNPAPNLDTMAKLRYAGPGGPKEIDVTILGQSPDLHVEVPRDPSLGDGWNQGCVRLTDSPVSIFDQMVWTTLAAVDQVCKVPPIIWEKLAVIAVAGDVTAPLAPFLAGTGGVCAMTKPPGAPGAPGGPSRVVATVCLAGGEILEFLEGLAADDLQVQLIARQISCPEDEQVESDVISIDRTTEHATFTLEVCDRGSIRYNLMDFAGDEILLLGGTGGSWNETSLLGALDGLPAPRQGSGGGDASSVHTCADPIFRNGEVVGYVGTEERAVSTVGCHEGTGSMHLALYARKQEMGAVVDGTETCGGEAAVAEGGIAGTYTVGLHPDQQLRVRLGFLRPSPDGMEGQDVRIEATILPLYPGLDPLEVCYFRGDAEPCGASGREEVETVFSFDSVRRAKRQMLRQVGLTEPSISRQFREWATQLGAESPLGEFVQGPLSRETSRGIMADAELWDDSSCLEIDFALSVTGSARQEGVGWTYVIDELEWSFDVEPLGTPSGSPSPRAAAPSSGIQGAPAMPGPRPTEGSLSSPPSPYRVTSPYPGR